MIRHKLLAAALAAAVVSLGAAGAGAEARERGRDLNAVLGAQTSLAQAVGIAETQIGGKATKVRLEREDGKYLYEIEIVAPDQVTEVMVDPASGKIVRTDNQGLFARIFHRQDRSDMVKLASSATTLAGAIAAAESETGGKATRAELEREDGTPRYEVRTVKDNARAKVDIDAATGKVIKVATRDQRKNDER